MDDGTTANRLRVLIADSTCATINFNADYTIDLNSGLGQLFSYYDVVIDGTEHNSVINGAGCAACRVLTITTNRNVTLNPLTMHDGKESTV